MLIIRRIIGLFSKLLSPGYSACGRCWRTWNICTEHSTQYTMQEDGASWGCFPLCEECWQGLTPESRLPYYRQLIEEWDDQGVWPAVKAAVLEGL